MYLFKLLAVKFHFILKLSCLLVPMWHVHCWSAIALTLSLIWSWLGTPIAHASPPPSSHASWFPNAVYLSRHFDSSIEANTTQHFASPHTHLAITRRACHFFSSRSALLLSFLLAEALADRCSDLSPRCNIPEWPTQVLPNQAAASSWCCSVKLLWEKYVSLLPLNTVNVYPSHSVSIVRLLTRPVPVISRSAVRQ